MLSGIVTCILLVVFLAGWAWAWSPRRKTDFDGAARLPLDDDMPVDRMPVEHMPLDGMADGSGQEDVR